MSLLGVLLIMLPIYRVKCPKNSIIGARIGIFMPNLLIVGGWLFAIWRWIAFLPIAGELLSAHGSVNLVAHYP